MNYHGFLYTDGVSRTRSPARLTTEVLACRACPRLVAWRETIAHEKRAMYRHLPYWGRPVPGFGDPAARIVILGLAPGAHGANRTGRVFTGDRSGDFLFAALHRAGLANQRQSTSRDDGLALRDVFVTVPVRCVPPNNRPLPEELARCAPFLDRELASLPGLRVVITLGAIAWNAYFDHHGRVGARAAVARPKFGHGAVWVPSEGQAQVTSLTVLGSYHVSQQNTQTGRLTEAMFDAVVQRAQSLAGLLGSTLHRR